MALTFTETVASSSSSTATDRARHRPSRASKVIERYIDAIGGKNAVEKIVSTEVSGSIHAADGRSGSSFSAPFGALAQTLVTVAFTEHKTFGVETAAAVTLP